MEKRSPLELLLAAGLLAGGVYFLFNTERGRLLREKLLRTAMDKVDDWLGELEQELSEAEGDALRTPGNEPG